MSGAERQSLKFILRLLRFERPATGTCPCYALINNLLVYLISIERLAGRLSPAHVYVHTRQCIILDSTVGSSWRFTARDERISSVSRYRNIAENNPWINTHDTRETIID